MQVSLFNLSKQYDDAWALHDVSLGLSPGRIVAVLGNNGAGKSTLLRLLSGVSLPTKGHVLYDDEEFTRDKMHLRRRLGFLPDVSPVLPHYTPIEHIGMCLNLYEAHRPGIESEAVSLLRDFDLLEHAESKVSTLSRGQAYKTALCGLLLADPDLMMFDEPFASGMDPHGLSVFRRLLQKAVGRGKTVLYTTQLVELAESFSDEVVVLDRAHLKTHTTLPELKAQLETKDHVLERLFNELRASV